MTNLGVYLRRNVFEPAYCLLSRSPKLRYWRELEKTQYLPEEKLREIQWQRVGELIRFVYQNNEFYRKRLEKAGVSPKDIQSPEDLRRLPLLTKAEIRANTPAMISKGFRMETLQKAKTGGSTGKALEIYFTEECSELRNACARRHDRWTGWEPGEPIAACWGNPHLPKTVKDKIKQRLLQPMIYLDTMSVNEGSVRVFVREWRKVKPTLLFGHAHSIFVLAQCLTDLGINVVRPKGILSTSMMLLPSERKVIEAVFGVKVTDRYGCEEVSLIACECEKHEGMHLNIEHLFIEFLRDDGGEAKPGEAGQIVVTDLLNKAMPFIRYQVEDVGLPSDKTCSCGRGMPLMDKVIGRMADFLIKRDGTQIAGISLIENSLTKIPGIVQMQIVQEAIDSILLNVVPGEAFDSSKEEMLIKYFRKLFEMEAEVRVNYMKEIPADASGKYRFCKSLVAR